MGICMPFTPGPAPFHKARRGQTQRARSDSFVPSLRRSTERLVGFVFQDRNAELGFTPLLKRDTRGDARSLLGLLWKPHLTVSKPPLKMHGVALSLLSSKSTTKYGTPCNKPCKVGVGGCGWLMLA